MLGIQLLRLPFQAQLEITDVCNLRCGYCYHFDTNNMPASRDLSDEKILQIVEKIINLKIYSLVLTGGEPLARPEILVKIVEKIKAANIYVSINTNLLLLTPQILIKLKELKVDSFLVSCPASEPDVYRKITRLGDYNVFRQKLRMLLNFNIPCLVNMVVTQDNFSFIRSTAKDLSILGVKRFSITPACLNVEYPDLKSLLSKEQVFVLLENLQWCVDSLGLEVDTLVALPKCFFPGWWWQRDNFLLKNRTCQAGRMSVNISNIGDVRPCPHNPIIYGNLFLESMESIWEKMMIYRNNYTIPMICKNCSTVESCRGACRTNALAISGQLNEPDRLTIGPVELPEKKQKNVIFDENSVVNFKGKLRWRKELEGYYSVTSEKGSSNLTIVNEELFRFLCWLEELLPLTIKELMQKTADCSSRECFMEVLESIIKKEVIIVS